MRRAEPGAPPSPSREGLLHTRRSGWGLFVESVEHCHKYNRQNSQCFVAELILWIVRSCREAAGL